MHQDVLLVEQTLLGDPQAFEQLIKKYHKAIYALIRRWVQSPEDAEEITQDVFLKAYQNLGFLRQPEHFDAWLRQIARHECQNWQRRKPPDLQMLSPDIAADIPSADEQLLQREAVDKVLQAVENLPELERELLKARYLEEVSYAQLQTEHGLSYKAITMRVLRAKRKVRRQVEKLFSEFVVSPREEAMSSLRMKTRESEVQQIPPQKGVQAMRYIYTHPAELFPASQDGKFGYISKSGEMIIPPQFDRALYFSEGLARVAIDEKHGFIDKTGKIVIPLQFDWAYSSSEGLAPVKVGDKHGYIDKTGQVVIQPQFDNVESFHDGFAPVQLGEKWGYIDEAGKYIAKPQFDKVWSFSGGIAPVTVGNRHGYIDGTGKSIWMNQ